MYAFGISHADPEVMLRNHDIVAGAGGNAAVININSIGYGGFSFLRKRSRLVLHAHRNGWDILTRHPGLGLDFRVYQQFWRLLGVDQFQINGIGAKYWEPDESFVRSFQAISTPLFTPADCPLPLPIPEPRHWSVDALLAVTACPTDAVELAHLRAQYYGMISEVDHHVGRIVAALKARGEWENTMIVITADHGEQLGDQGLQQKCGYFESSYHIIGIVRDPRHPAGHGRVVEDFTENVDIMPTLCEMMEVPVPVQCDGFPLTPFLIGNDSPHWRESAHYEWDWRDMFIEHDEHLFPWDRRLERHNIAVLRTDSHTYVQFANGDWLCFDLATDPTWQTLITEPAVVLPLAQEMLVWRQQHLDRQLTGMLMRDGGIGRHPDPVPAS